MKLFVDKVSTHEGVEVPDQNDVPEDKNTPEQGGNDRQQNSSTEEFSDKIDFDPKKFMESIHDLLGMRSLIQLFLVLLFNLHE